MISAFHWKLFLKSLNVWHYHFPLKYLFGNSPLSFVSGSILFEFAILPDVYISGALFLLREHMHSKNLAAHLSKSLNPLCLQLYLQLVCLGNTSKKRECKKTAPSLVLSVETFDKGIDESGQHKHGIQLRSGAYYHTK